MTTITLPHRVLAGAYDHASVVHLQDRVLVTIELRTKKGLRSVTLDFSRGAYEDLKYLMDVAPVGLETVGADQSKAPEDTGMMAPEVTAALEYAVKVLRWRLEPKADRDALLIEMHLRWLEKLPEPQATTEQKAKP